MVHALEARIIRELLLPPSTPAPPPAAVSAPPLSDPEGQAGTEPSHDAAASALTAAALPPVSPHRHRSGTASVIAASRPELQLELPDGFHRCKPPHNEPPPFLSVPRLRAHGGAQLHSPVCCYALHIFNYVAWTST